MKNYLLKGISLVMMVAALATTSCKEDDPVLSKESSVTAATVKGTVVGVTVAIKDADIVVSKDDGSAATSATIILTLSANATATYDGVAVVGNEIAVALDAGSSNDLVVTAQDKIAVSTYKVKVKLVVLESLVAFWNFEGDSPLEDKTGNGHDGTISNTVNQVAGVKGDANSAYDFVGNTAGDNVNAGYIEIENSALLTNASSLTISYWVKVKELKADGEYYVVSNNSWAGYKTSLPAHGAMVSTISYGTLAERTGGSDYDAEQVVKLVPGTWAMFTTTYDQTSGKHINYYNGVLAGEKIVTPGEALRHFATDAIFVIGTETSSAGWDQYIGEPWYDASYKYKATFSGSIDNVRIYNEALTPSQIATIYANEKN
ncbi:MAG: LamG domain-containing protein [Salinivirgaceae bacterium]